MFTRPIDCKEDLMMERKRRFSRILPGVFATLVLIGVSGPARAQQPECKHTTRADVVAIDQAFYINRLGAIQAGGMMFALRRDVVSNDPSTRNLTPGKVMLRPDKRPRPIVLRVRVNDCLEIKFQNLLGSVPRVFDPKRFPVKSTLANAYRPNENAMVNANDGNPPNQQTFGTDTEQPATRYAGVHVEGMNLVKAAAADGTPIEGISADGSWVGRNDVFGTASRKSGLVAPGDTITYTLYAAAEGSFLLYSTAADVGLRLDFGGQLSQGLFGNVTVQPQDAEFYRSQVTHDDLMQATYISTSLPPNMSLAPFMENGTQKTVTLEGKTFPVWEIKITNPVGNQHNLQDGQVIIADEGGNPVPPTQRGYLKSPGGQPLVNYGAVYPSNDTNQNRRCVPILKMVDSAYKTTQTGCEKVIDPAADITYHSDLTAIITGTDAGLFIGDAPTFDQNPPYPDRRHPYREFAIHYHDDFVATQAFPQFTSGDMAYTLQAGRDFFAINYGMAAIGPPIWANRTKVGPEYQCATCRFEEFFLSSWPNGDPSMIVDIPANAVDPSTNQIKPGPKATKAFYPDDPSNVYHSYMGDHVKFRVLHAGQNITHVHHLHAHQWLHTPNSDQSHYRDSQMISPGIAYTMEHVYRGSGNLNQTVGDSIFHCHFYPHFAQGMWALWRVHDTFEIGTELDNTGKPKPGWNRALPDGEITTGVPIPGLVPMPIYAMAPMPARVEVVPVNATVKNASGQSVNTVVGYKSEVNPQDLAAGRNPGYPFFIPGIAGQRVPHPPLDYAPDLDDNGQPRLGPDGKPQLLDGGLPRYVGLYDPKIYEQHNRWDFTKLNDTLTAFELPEDGTPVEDVAMTTHSIRNHPSFTPGGAPKDFILNGRPRQPGAPYADPGIKLDGSPVLEKPIQYKAADIQLDLVLNKKGWHYPQARIISLWGDVNDTLSGKRAPEPLFFRSNSGQVIEYWLANLVPNYYELDDFQVRTPTDVLGQHIHLVKFDVTSSDGAANGFNYEDGTFSPDEVREQIEAINKAGGIYADSMLKSGTQRQLHPKNIPFFGNGPNNAWVGAQATVQRWYSDPLLDNEGHDRTITTVFTHDHFSPSTHQQIGLYAGLLVEPKGSQWQDPETGAFFGTRFDGGPTSWQAIIINKDEPSKTYREFMLEFQDRQLAYLNTSITTLVPYVPYGPNLPKKSPGGPFGWSDPNNAINPPINGGSSDPGGPPYPHLITNQFSTGSFSVSYRNEPLPYRLSPPKSGEYSVPAQTDLSYVFNSITRTDPDLNRQPDTGGVINPACNPAVTACFTYPKSPIGGGMLATDPYTPLLRAYEGDRVQIRVLVGAHMSAHFFTIHGVNWLFEPAYGDSGYRSTQGMGISEHYEMHFTLPRTSATTEQADYLYIPSSDATGLQNGNWGLMRSYKTSQADLLPLPNNKNFASHTTPNAGCPNGAPVRSFDVTATTAQQALGGPLFYNRRGRPGTPGQNQIVDTNALLYVQSSDLDGQGKLKADVPVEPLILRANAGDCMVVTLRNELPSDQTSLNGGSNLTVPFTVPVTVTDRASNIQEMVFFFNQNTYYAGFQELFNQNPYGFKLPDNPGLTQVAKSPNNQGWTITVNSTGQQYTIYQTNSTTLGVSCGITLNTSHEVGLHPTLVGFDITESNGVNAGLNPSNTAKPGSAKNLHVVCRKSRDRRRDRRNPLCAGRVWLGKPDAFGPVDAAPVRADRIVDSRAGRFNLADG